MDQVCAAATSMLRLCTTRVSAMGPLTASSTYFALAAK